MRDVDPVSPPNAASESHSGASPSVSGGTSHDRTETRTAQGRSLEHMEGSDIYVGAFTDRMVLFSAGLGMALLFALFALYVGGLVLDGIREREAWSRTQFAEVLIRKIGIENYVSSVAAVLVLERRITKAPEEINEQLRGRLARSANGVWVRLPPTPQRGSVGVLRWAPNSADEPRLLELSERLAQIDNMVLHPRAAGMYSLLLDPAGRLLLASPAPETKGEAVEILAGAIVPPKPALSYLGIPGLPPVEREGRSGCTWWPAGTAIFGPSALLCLRPLVSGEGLPLVVIGASVAGEGLFPNLDARERQPDRYTIFDGFGMAIAEHGQQGLSIADNRLVAPGASGWRLADDGLHIMSTDISGRGSWRMVSVYPLADIVRDRALPFGVASLFFLLGTGLVLGAAWRLHARIVRPAREQAILIHESEAFHRTAMRTAPVGLAILRRGDAELLEANALGSGLLADLAVRRDILLQADGFAGRGGNGVASIEVAWRSLQSPARTLSVAMADLQFHGQSAFFCAVTDVSLYKSLVLDLAQAKQDADAANAAKSAYLTTMSHEIRTPLYGVLGSLELVARGRLEPRQRDLIGGVQRSSSALLQIVSDLLDFAKIEAGELALREETLDPVALVEDVVRSLAPLAAAKNLALVCCIQPGLACLRGDPLRLRQILFNLLSNAIKYTEHGRVLVDLAARAEGLHCALELRVVDSGPGMTPAEQARLFTPFVQGEGGQVQGGTGLGLSICRQLAEMMRGRIDVASERYLGSSFTLRVSLPNEGEAPLRSLAVLPAIRIDVADVDFAGYLAALVRHCGGQLADVSDADAEAPAILLVDTLAGVARAARVCVLPDGPLAPESEGADWRVSAYSQAGILDALVAAGGGAAPEAAAPQNQSIPQLGLKVLVAEDHPINQMLLRAQLQALGCSVVLAGNGEEALTSWQEGDFDLLLTDVNMPVSDGFALTHSLREQGVRKPIVGVTAGLGDEARCIAAGMDACIVKPINVEMLGEALRPFAGAASAPPDAVPGDSDTNSRLP